MTTTAGSALPTWEAGALEPRRFARRQADGIFESSSAQDIGIAALPRAWHVGC